MKFEYIISLKDNFIRIAKQYSNSPEDVVQELYLKLWQIYNSDVKKIIKDGELNMAYIYKAIKNISHEQAIFQRRRVDLPDYVNCNDDYSNLEVEICLRSEKPYYKELYKSFKEYGSMRALSCHRKLALGTIHRDINYIKKKLKVLK